MWSIQRMDGGARAGADTDLICGAGMVAVGQQNLADTKPGNLFEICGRRLNGVDAEISARVENQVAVEVIAVRFRKPWPGEYACQDLSHHLLSFQFARAIGNQVEDRGSKMEDRNFLSSILDPRFSILILMM